MASGGRRGVAECARARAKLKSPDGKCRPPPPNARVGKVSPELLVAEACRRTRETARTALRMSCAAAFLPDKMAGHLPTRYGGQVGKVGRRKMVVISTHNKNDDYHRCHVSFTIEIPHKGIACHCQ